MILVFCFFFFFENMCFHIFTTDFFWFPSVNVTVVTFYFDLKTYYVSIENSWAKISGLKTLPVAQIFDSVENFTKL